MNCVQLCCDPRSAVQRPHLRLISLMMLVGAPLVGTRNDFTFDSAGDGVLKHSLPLAARPGLPVSNSQGIANLAHDCSHDQAIVGGFPRRSCGSLEVVDEIPSVTNTASGRAGPKVRVVGSQW
jgi:hypothetical protein